MSILDVFRQKKPKQSDYEFHAELKRKHEEKYDCATFCALCKAPLQETKTVTEYDVCTGETLRTLELKRCPNYATSFATYEDVKTYYSAFSASGFSKPGNGHTRMNRKYDGFLVDLGETNARP